MNSSDNIAPNVPGPIPPRRRRLRAVFAADIANYGGLMTIDETNTLDALWITRRIATEELATHGGWLFGLPGDGIFALFESTVDAVRCALCIQSRLSQCPKLYALKLRIGVHLGEVLFQDELPYGEALVIAARLEGLAEPGGILVSASVMEAVAPRIAATFIENGFPALKHCPRRIETFRVLPPPANELRPADALLDRTIAPHRVAPPEPEPQLDPASTRQIAPLPKATPLALPTEIAKLEDAPIAAAPVVVPSLPVKAPPVEEKSIKAQAAAFDDASLGQIANLLALYFGPVAKMLVRRTAAECADTTQLIRVLAQEIPTEHERVDFLKRAADALGKRR